MFRLFIFRCENTSFRSRFGRNLKRFIKTQSIPQSERVIDIKLDAEDENGLILSILKEKNQDLSMNVYVYKGLAGFRVSFNDSLNSHLINMMTLMKKNFFVIVFALLDHIKVARFIFI